MIKLLIRILLLGLPFALFVGVFEVTQRSANNNQYAVKQRLLDAAGGGVEVLTLGSSHGYRGILPAELGRPAFNLAATNQSIYYDVELALKYVPRLPRLKAVILPIDYHSLERQLDQRTEVWRCYYYRKFYSIPHRTREASDDIRNFSLYFLYGRDSRGPLDEDLRKDYDQLGGLVQDSPARTAEELSASAKRNFELHERSMYPDNILENIAALERLESQLRQRGVKLILVTVPVTSYYREAMRADALARMRQALGGFCERRSVPFHDYLGDQRFTDGDFRDGDHLNHAGAVKFSRILAAETLAPPAGQ